MRELRNSSVDDAKKVLLRVFFGGAPADDNPLLWGLANDVAMLRNTIMADPEYSYLGEKFGERPRPDITMFAYAAFDNEDELLPKLMSVITARVPDVRYSALSFDGCVATLRGLTHELQNTLEGALADFFTETNVKAVIKPRPLQASNVET